MGQVVLVTGVAGDLARRFARQLAGSRAVDRVIGVDIVPPRGDLGTVQFVRADIRNPVIAKVIVRERVDTVVHAMVAASAGPHSGRVALKELNVIGTMQLLAACQQAPDLRRVVVKSHSVVYGATNRDPAMFTEGMGAKRAPSGGFAKDITEIEAYTRGFARRRPDVGVTTLRMANTIGPSVDSPMVNYLRMPIVPTVLGFDPRLQFLHEQDALGALEHATTGGDDVIGTYNVTGDGVILLSQAVRRLGRPTLPLPSAALVPVGNALGRPQRARFSKELATLLTYGRGMDTTRMRTQFGFAPNYTTLSAFEDFAASVAPGVLDPRRVRAVEKALAGRLESPPALPSRARPVALPDPQGGTRG